jgi:hypothetical protein
MPNNRSIRQRIEAGEEIDLNAIKFTHKPNDYSNIQYATHHGFLFTLNDKQSSSRNSVLTKEEIDLRNNEIIEKFDSDDWKNSNMRDRVYRRKMYSIRQEIYINRDGEESVRTFYPAFNSFDLEAYLNARVAEFEATRNPACLHDWKASVTNGCSEAELRDTIIDLRVAEQSYPEERYCKSRTHYITDNEGFIKRIVRRRNKKGNNQIPRQKKNIYSTALLRVKNVADLSDM